MSSDDCTTRTITSRHVYEVTVCDRTTDTVTDTVKVVGATRDEALLKAGLQLGDKIVDVKFAVIVVEVGSYKGERNILFTSAE